MLIYKYLFLFILFINANANNQTLSNSFYINRNNFTIDGGKYLIENREGNLGLIYNKTLLFKNKEKVLKENIEIFKEREEYYKILISFKEKGIVYKRYLSIDGDNNLIVKSDSFFQNKDCLLWKIIPKINKENILIYFIQNKANKRFLELGQLNNSLTMNTYINKSELHKFNEFRFIELYKKLEETQIKSSLLLKEPIDVLIKYIDLTDKNLVREGIQQIAKDIDNEELRYSVRSILQNIPWIRKIFILMPNERVKFFKPYEEIKEKIVYVNDKDLLGFDSSNPMVFQFNLHKLKKIGLSENFILMDDDYFIAKKINKNELFYEENGQILPALITSDYYELEKEKLQQKLKKNLSFKDGQDPHSTIGFNTIQIRSLLFLYEIFGDDDKRFGKKLIEPAFTHNAIPVKMSDIKEIHDYVLDKYNYGKEMLSSKVRNIQDLQFQTLYMAYVKNKYDRKVSKIDAQFFDLYHAGNLRHNKYKKIKLFVINTSNRKYRSIYFQREREILNKLFPTKSKYELDDEIIDYPETLLKIDKKTTINLSYIDINISTIKSKTNSEKIKYYDSILSLIKKRIEEINKINENEKNNMLKLNFLKKELQNQISLLDKNIKKLEISNLIFFLSFVGAILIIIYKK